MERSNGRLSPSQVVQEARLRVPGVAVIRSASYYVRVWRKLVDAPDSKSGSLRGVGVRFPSPAP